MSLCAECDRANAPNARFCRYCGKAMHMEPASPPPGTSPVASHMEPASPPPGTSPVASHMEPASSPPTTAPPVAVPNPSTAPLLGVPSVAVGSEWGELVITRAALYFFPAGWLATKSLEQDLTQTPFDGPRMRPSMGELVPLPATIDEDSAEHLLSDYFANGRHRTVLPELPASARLMHGEPLSRPKRLALSEVKHFGHQSNSRYLEIVSEYLDYDFLFPTLEEARGVFDHLNGLGLTASAVVPANQGVMRLSGARTLVGGLFGLAVVIAIAWWLVTSGFKGESVFWTLGVPGGVAFVAVIRGAWSFVQGLNESEFKGF